MCGLPVGANRRLNLCIPKGDIVAFRETTFKLLTIYWTLPLESLVNPLNSNAMSQAIEILNLRKTEPFDPAGITRIVSEHYVYLGWVVLDNHDVQLLKSTLKNRSDDMRSNDLNAKSKSLYRLKLGVEKYFAKDQTNKTELAKIRSRIPVFFERLNSTRGHPCEFMHVLYLDGHTEKIKFGSNFPATKEFMNAF